MHESVEGGDVALFALDEIADGVEVRREGRSGAASPADPRFEGSSARRRTTRYGRGAPAPLQEGGPIDGACGGRRLSALRRRRGRMLHLSKASLLSSPTWILFFSSLIARGTPIEGRFV